MLNSFTSSIVICQHERIQYFATGAGELPDHEVASLIHTAKERGVQVGESQVCHGPGESLEQGAIGGSQAQHADHSMVVGSWKRTYKGHKKILKKFWTSVNGPFSQVVNSRVK